MRLTRCVEPPAATGMTISMIHVPTTLITLAATSVALNNSLQPREKCSLGTLAHFRQLRNRALAERRQENDVSECRYRKGEVIRIGHGGRAQPPGDQHRRTESEQRHDQRCRRNPCEGTKQASLLELEKARSAHATRTS